MIIKYLILKMIHSLLSNEIKIILVRNIQKIFRIERRHYENNKNLLNN